MCGVDPVPSSGRPGRTPLLRLHRSVVDALAVARGAVDLARRLNDVRRMDIAADPRAEETGIRDRARLRAERAVHRLDMATEASRQRFDSFLYGLGGAP